LPALPPLLPFLEQANKIGTNKKAIRLKENRGTLINAYIQKQKK
jgi:hypothetical protein